MTAGQAIRVGIGGWTYAPWRGLFYPDDLPQSKELAYASGRLSSIEINGTYYGTQKPASFAKWRDETPDSFVFSLKGPRFATNRRVLAESGPSVERFLDSGLLQLGDKLGPINWQFLPAKKFEPEDFEAFLRLLPPEREGLRLRHAVEVRHPSFETPAFLDLAARYGIAVVLTDKPDFPNFERLTAPFAYVRLQTASEAEPSGYPPHQLDRWAEQARRWSDGPDGRQVFVYMINGCKPKAPAAAMALIDRLPESGH